MREPRTAAVAKRVVAQFRHDRRSLGLLFGVPLLLLSLIGLLWGPAATTKREPVAVVNDDRGPVGNAFADALSDAASIEVVDLASEAPEDALRRGALSAFIRLPADLSQAVLAGRGLRISIEIEGSDPFRNATVVSAVQRGLIEAASRALSRMPGGGGAALDLEVTYLYGGPDYSTLDYLAPVLIPFLAFFLVFLLTDVAFLRERASGTLERLMATPLGRGELVAGYVLGLSVFALLQSLVVVLFSVYVLGVRFRGNLGTVFLVEATMVLGAVCLGLFVSAFARNEFQAVQFTPVVVLPQALLSGIFVPVQDLPVLLRPLAWFMPLTYANEALRAVMIKGAAIGDPLVVRDLAALTIFAVVAAVAAVATIRREIA